MTLLDTAAIAAMFGVTQKTVTDKWSKAPDFPLPVRKVNRRYRWWSAESVEQWAAARAGRQLPAPSLCNTSSGSD